MVLITAKTKPPTKVMGTFSTKAGQVRPPPYQCTILLANLHQTILAIFSCLAFNGRLRIWSCSTF
jgi:hypothetical protein